MKIIDLKPILTGDVMLSWYTASKGYIERFFSDEDLSTMYKNYGDVLIDWIEPTENGERPVTFMRVARPEQTVDILEVFDKLKFYNLPKNCRVEYEEEYTVYSRHKVSGDKELFIIDKEGEYWSITDNKEWFDAHILPQL